MSATPASALAVIRDAYGRVLRAPVVIAGAWLALVATSLPFAATLGRAIQRDLGASTAAAPAAQGVNFDWWQEFTFRHPEHEKSFQPSIIGGAAALRNVSDWLDNTESAAPLVAAGVFVTAWTFLLGGTLDRYARGRRVGAAAYFAACGVYFWRFLRLGVAAALAYLFLFGALHPWLFETVYPWVTRDLSVERTAFLWRVLLYVGFLLALGAVLLLFDYAKVRLVVEDRRSALGALVAAARFIRRHPGVTSLLFVLNVVLYLVVTVAYIALAPGARHDAMLGILLTLGAGQVYLVARIVVKLGFYATATVLFEDRLAHRAYTAPPEPVWPDSPAAEALTNAPPATSRPIS
jgi:hypothetical protein